MSEDALSLVVMLLLLITPMAVGMCYMVPELESVNSAIGSHVSVETVVTGGNITLSVGDNEIVIIRKLYGPSVTVIYDNGSMSLDNCVLPPGKYLLSSRPVAATAKIYRVSDPELVVREYSRIDNIINNAFILDIVVFVAEAAVVALIFRRYGFDIGAVALISFIAGVLLAGIVCGEIILVLCGPNEDIQTVLRVLGEIPMTSAGEGEIVPVLIPIPIPIR